MDDNALRIRTARLSDAPALLKIYAPYVEKTAITFEYTVPDVEEFAARMLEKGVYVIGFCYPVVPMGKARIRTQVSAGHSKEDLEFAVKCFKEVKEEMGL